MNSIISPALENPPVPTVLPKIGDILLGFYGYEASIATFAKVVALGNKTIKLVELETRAAYKPNSGGMYWTATPMVDSARGAVVTKKFECSERGYSVKWSSYQRLHGPASTDPVECYNVH